MSKAAKLPKNISESHVNQINVLKALCSVTMELRDARGLSINEISQISGLKDEKETQRYLFILEGQKLACPFPEGDFTSRMWQITKYGAKAVKTIEKAMVQ